MFDHGKYLDPLAFDTDGPFVSGGRSLDDAGIVVQLFGVYRKEQTRFIHAFPFSQAARLLPRLSAS